ncbi:hypothetical protein [Desulfuribacillus alkaliarsenatis]|uniref:Uncharacterized protein n=1 Tax=Desulfuribacillus alkaliarsenatis TaxID=766136 RepID=A0A1E5G2X4_9FIRM|nr:hypothetical protein [Desulfuribacillus alkaliarsenatis]OEF97435.1 hypothetical protein BHF68_04290 [Desulfuribacillus alkaliarsenatis]
MLTATNLWKYVGRFSIVHLATYTILALAFVAFQGALPDSKRIALDFYQVYRIDAIALIGHLARGAVLALLLYPFYKTFVSSTHGPLILFGAMWGIVIFGSVEPMPGTFEGIIYTTTSLFEHLSVLIASSIQIGLFCWLFLRWEVPTKSLVKESIETKQPLIAEQTPINESLRTKLQGFVKRFTLLHVLTYWIVGSIFYQIQDYDAALSTMEAFDLFRDLENMTMVIVVFLGQIIRGAMLAMLIYPFYQTFMSKRHGWLLIFSLMYGLTLIGTMLFIPATFDDVIALNIAEFITLFKVGIPEVTVQMFVFSWLLFKWEQKKHKSISGGIANDITTDNKSQ